MKIQKFLRDKLIANKNNLNNRVNAYKLVSSRLAGIQSNDCLEKKVFNGTQGYTIRNVINLEKQIGTPSKFGAIYLTSIPDFLGIYPIASKVMPDSRDNEKEVKLMTKITNEILLQKTSRHFLMIYGSCVCTKQIAEKLKLVSINELADGDLKSLIHNRDFVRDTELTFNILIQTFISIATFQNVLGHIHRDPHYGNFLFQNNNDKGYYHYIFNGVSYYLKACKYNIIIYDYGLASPITEYKKTALPGLINSQCRMISYDYTNIIHSFFNSSAHKIKDYPNKHPEATHKATLAIHNNLENLLTEEYAKNKAKNGEKHYENYIFEYIIQEFLKYAPKGMFLTKRPLNVINSTPFYISSPQATKSAKSAKATKVAKA
jgi:thiamine kinase-like enzyme